MSNVLTIPVQEAIIFAAEAHGKQTRKGSTAPYIIHPMSVAMLLSSHGFEDEVIIAGLLHDVIEDTKVSRTEIISKFGIIIHNWVSELSEPSHSVAWEQRKRESVAKVKTMDWQVLAIKAADVTSNMMDFGVGHADQGDAYFESFHGGKYAQIARFSVLVHAILTRYSELQDNYRPNYSEQQEGLFKELEVTLEYFLKCF